MRALTSCFLCLLCLLCLVLSACVSPGPSNPDPEEPGEDKAAQLVEYLKDHPGDIQACADLLRLQMERADEAGARLTIDHVVHHSEKDFRAWMLAAQFSRWQLDLITAEKHLKHARELAPVNVEPFVALAALYRDAALDDLELQQREAAVHLAVPAVRPEFMLDLAYARAGAGQTDAAMTQARALAEGGSDSLLRSRALLLVSELNLDAGDEAASVAAVLAAQKLEPRDRDIVRFAARLASALRDATPLRPMFENVLANVEDPDARFAALFGAWSVALCGALEAKTDPFAKDIEALWLRLFEIGRGQPDSLARRYLLLMLYEHRKPEAERVAKRLEELGFGAPFVASSPQSLVALWRAEDCLRLGAARPALAALEQLMPREPGMAALKLLKATALFVSRHDGACLQYVDSLLEQSGGKGDELIALKRQILLRQGKAVELAREMEAAEPRSQNDIWTLAVARFHTYRKQ